MPPVRPRSSPSGGDLDRARRDKDCRDADLRDQRRGAYDPARRKPVKDGIEAKLPEGLQRPRKGGGRRRRARET